MLDMGSKVGRDLLLEFFLTFSRMEYALKASGFFKPGRGNPPNAGPDWDRFAVSLRDKFQSEDNPQLREACEYLNDSPPWKQVIVNNELTWDSPSAWPANESDIEYLLKMVGSVRNNLFHGGKHNRLHEGPERTKKLLNSSLVILKRCLALSPKVQKYFVDAVL